MSSAISPDLQPSVASKVGQAHPALSFIAGTVSGTTKCLVGHPFDTIKTRMQTNPAFKGPWECLTKTLRLEGVRGFYKGLTPPLVGWVFMDSVMLGSLHTYRRWIGYITGQESLSLFSHGVAGAMAGFTFQSHGIRGIYQGLFSTIIFRTAFFVWWSTYELYTRLFKRHTRLSDASINFWAGGLSAQTFWLAAFPFDVVKQRVMTDAIDAEKRRYRGWSEAWVEVWRREGLRGYYRGFVPCVLRAFPANAAALFMFEQTMRVMELS